MLKDSNSNNKFENCKLFEYISLLLFSIEEPVIEDYLTWGLKNWQHLPTKDPRTMSGVDRTKFPQLAATRDRQGMWSAHWGTLGHFDKVELGDWIIVLNNSSVVYMYHILFIHSSVRGHLRCLHVLAIVNSAIVDTGAHESFIVMVFSRYVCQGVGFLGPKWDKIQKKRGYMYMERCFTLMSGRNGYNIVKQLYTNIFFAAESLQSTHHKIHPFKHTIQWCLYI